MVVAGRCCIGAGAEGATVGRAGARAGAGRPAERLRGILAVVVVLLWFWRRYGGGGRWDVILLLLL